VACDTSSVTVAEIVFLQYLYSVICSVTWFKFKFESFFVYSNLVFWIFINRVIFTTCKETPNS
jgi:hypothetical protein